MELQVINLESELKIYKSLFFVCFFFNYKIIIKKFSIPDLKVILVNSKVERNTSRMVQYVKDKFDKVSIYKYLL